MRRAVRATSPDGSIRAVVRGLHQRLHVPVAGWLGIGGNPLALVGAHGQTLTQTKALRNRVGSIPRTRGATGDRHQAHRKRFAGIVGARSVEVVDAGDGLLMVGDPPRECGPVLRRLGPFLTDVLGHLTAVAVAEQRNEGLDLGLDRVLHELRGPALAAVTVMEHLLARAWCSGQERELVSLAKGQLQDLASLMEITLLWTVDEEVLERSETELVGVVRMAVQSRGDGQADRTQVTAPRAISIDGDARRLQTAFSSLVQAALGSATDGSLTVEVTGLQDRAVVRISHRPGGFAPPRQGVLFDPFAGAGGSGLSHAGPVALLAARRVIEAHGGVVWPESGEDEVVFHVELPRRAERSRRFAS